MFREERYGEGIYNAVVGVANRLRDIDRGVASKGRASVDDILDALGLMGLVGIPTFVACAIGNQIYRDKMEEYEMRSNHHWSKSWNLCIIIASVKSLGTTSTVTVKSQMKKSGPKLSVPIRWKPI